ncbi:MAG TPA: hypothetical protein VF576_08640 [Rubricoccaceae bacterium]
MRVALAVALVCAAPAFAQGASDLSSPFSLTRPREGDGPASAYLRLRDAEAAYRGSTDWWSNYAQNRAGAAARLGLHAEALRYYDASSGAGPDSVGVLPPGTRAVDAVDYLAAAADTARVIIVNEAHHDAASRLLTLRLLPVLYERGFRYFAAETFAPDSVLAAQPPYPTAAMGHFVGEPVFGQVVREALRLGYTLVPYEIEDADEATADTALSRQQLRDMTQARHLAERTVVRDPEARVLVHAGFGHVYEGADEYWYPMALYFRERTGIDPLTVDQVEMSERSELAFEHPRYRAAVDAGLVGEASVVLVDPAGAPLAPVGGALVDLQAVRPRTVYRGGRPTWMRLGGRSYRESVDLPAVCAAVLCVVEARELGEPRDALPPGAGPSDAVPLDRVLAEGAGPVMLFRPRSAWIKTVRDGQTGATLLHVFVGSFRID